MSLNQKKRSPNETRDDELFKKPAPPANRKAQVIYPGRPLINTKIMEILATYRGIARNLMIKKNMQPFNFDSMETDYLRIYQLMTKRE
jgi:hypothetical protein